MEKLITAIELSPSGINIVTGYTFNDSVYVLKSIARKGIALDENGYPEKQATLTALNEMLSTVKSQLHRKDLGSYVVLLPPDGFLVKEATTAYATVQDEVSHQDYKNACIVVRKKSLQEGYHFIYADPYRFSGDNYASREFPLGKNISTLTVNFDAHYITANSYDHYSAIIREMNFSSPLLLVSSFATSNYLNSFKEMNNGFILIELEPEHTNVSYCQEKRMVFSKSLPYGVNQAFKEASRKLGTGKDRMEELATLFGLRENAGFSFYTKEKYSLVMIAEALKAGFNPLLKQLTEDLMSLNIKPNSRYVLAGSGLNLEGLDKYFSDTLKKPFISLNKYVLGAREKNYLPCLGAIKLTANSYMDYLDNNRPSEPESEFTQNQFSRG